MLTATKNSNLKIEKQHLVKYREVVQLVRTAA